MLSIQKHKYLSKIMPIQRQFVESGTTHNNESRFYYQVCPPGQYQVDTSCIRNRLYNKIRVYIFRCKIICEFISLMDL